MNGAYQSLRLFWLVCCLVAAVPAHAKPRRRTAPQSPLQFFVDPTLPDQGWIVAGSSVQFNPGLKTGGKWLVKFDRETFRRLSGETPARNFHTERIQSSQIRRGAVILLVVSGEMRYAFLSLNGGDVWTLSQKAPLQTRQVAETPAVAAPTPSPPETPPRAADPITPETASAPGARLAPMTVPAKVETEKVEPASAAPDSPTRPPSKGVAESEAEQMLANAGRHRPRSGALFNFLFDLWLDARPGIGPLSFDTYHTLMLVDLHPAPDLELSAEVSPAPRFYEILYRASPTLEFRGGRIWVPFDQMNPHEIFGGFYNIDRLRQPGAPSFLPELWTDLGVAMKYRVVNNRRATLDLHAYVVNGFGSGGRDPGGALGAHYPTFTAAPSSDNNGDKAFGARLALNWGGVLGLGASLYTGRYTDAADYDRRLTMAGVDGQLTLGGTRLKAGYLLGMFNLARPGGETVNRTGFYVEASQRFGERWRLALRGGAQELDNRYATTGDRQLVGGELIYSWSYFQFGLLHYKDILAVPGKSATELSALRAIVMF